MANVEVTWNAAADETDIVNYNIDSTADINADPVVWDDHGNVAPNGGPYSQQVTMPNGVRTVRVRSVDADGQFGLNPLQGGHNAQDVLPPDPVGPLGLTNV